MRMRKPTVLCALLLVLLLFCCGCAFVGSADELYQLPQLSPEYEKLESLLQTILDSGAESIAPASGTNIQPVQMVDLNQDGHEEVVAFFYKAAEEKPLKIYIFQEQNDTYRQVALLEGAGSSIYSIQYNYMDGDGYSEIVVGWRSGADVLNLTVYSLRDFHSAVLLSAAYTRVAVEDFNGDGNSELVLLRNDTEAEIMVADYYTWPEDGSLQLSDSCRLSMTAAEFNRMTTGYLSGGEPALFVSGVHSGSYLMVDTLCADGARLHNATANAATGVTSAIYTFANLYPQDIDGDGSVNVPRIRDMYSQQENGTINQYSLVYWLEYAADGSSQEALITYYDAANGWYLEIPAAWTERLRVEVNDLLSGEHTVTFTVAGKSGHLSDTLTIYTLTGEDRERRSQLQGRSRLQSTADSIYAYIIKQADGSENHMYDAARLKDSFHLLTTQWYTG